MQVLSLISKDHILLKIQIDTALVLKETYLLFKMSSSLSDSRTLTRNFFSASRSVLTWATYIPEYRHICPTWHCLGIDFEVTGSYGTTYRAPRTHACQLCVPPYFADLQRRQIKHQV